MDHGGPELVGDAGAGETIADQRGEQVRKDLKLVDKMKQLMPTTIRMLIRKIDLNLIMTSSIAFLVMVIVLTYSGMIASSKVNFENQNFVGTNVTRDVNRAQNEDSGMIVSSQENEEESLSMEPFYFSFNLGGFFTNENVENQDFGRDINRHDYFSVTPFDPFYGDDSNISGLANHGGGGGGRIQVPISSNIDTTVDLGIGVSQTSDHERANIDETVISDITLPAIGISSTTVSSTGGDDGSDSDDEAAIQIFGPENGGGGGGDQGGCMVGEGWWELWWLLLALWKLV